MTLLQLLGLLPFAKIVVCTDETSFEISTCGVRGGFVVLRTTDGKLQSVPRSYLNCGV